MMRHQPSRHIGTCAAILAAGASFAQSPSPADTTRIYESRQEIVVTGLRTAVTRDLLPLSVTPVGSALLRSASARNVLPTVAASAPGVFITERGVEGFGVARGSAGLLSIRGLSSNRVAVLLDGRPYAMGLFGHPLGDFHVAPEAGSVEVVRGPASILYGSGAMGGVVNLLSPETGGEGFGGNADFSYGSFNTGHGAAALTYAGDGARGRAGVVRDRTDGHREGLDFSSTLGSAMAAVRVGGGLELRGSGSFQRSQSFDPGPVTLPAPYKNNRMDLDRGTAALTLGNTWKGMQGAAEVSYNWGDHDLQYNGFHSEDNTLTLSLYQSGSPLEGGVVTGGLEHRRYGGNAQEGAVDLGAHTMTSTAAYLLLLQELLPGASATAGTRVEYSDVFGTEVVPHAGIIVTPAAGLRLRGSVSRGYRNPTINELYFQYLGKRPNPDLEPEQLWSYELGAGMDIAGGAATLDVTVFQSDGSNLIENRPIVPPPTTPGPTSRPVNIGSLKNRGVEIEGRTRPLEDLALTLTGTYLDCEPSILSVPRLQLGGEVRYTIQPAAVRLFVHHVAHLLTATSPAEIVQTYTLVNLRASYFPTAVGEVYADVNNLLNETYEINAGYPMPGRYLAAGVRITVL